MRFLFLLAIACTSGCEQLSTPGSEREATAGLTRSTETIPAPPVRWTTSHEGIELSTAGMVSLVPDRGGSFEVMHVRVALSPRVGTFSADASAAQLDLPGLPALHPIAANAKLSTLPIASIEAGDVETLDLFFRLPTDRVGQTAVFSWFASTSRASIVLRALVPVAGDVADKPKLAGDRWWFTSAYDWSTFRHEDGVITPQPPTTAYVPQFDDDAIPNPCDEW
ncbi:MAG TPA: hypothetical protein VMJ10_06565 [Kofleriaceae bacterium]|nr:hypothetical protein [Kofleriaceae bacterium]